ncbi:hypothetical protein E2C01_060920 [Portunus trituberculatus]|uniref:Uncharacterized protein n=1 Tax=Portunus trituberculatus TaxID=210409 RepID=A0A5B7HBU7_PORTR|nr:hypothetical protein [Portunus trituberculatus]
MRNSSNSFVHKQQSSSYRPVATWKFCLGASQSQKNVNKQLNHFSLLGQNVNIYIQIYLHLLIKILLI